jgi:MFS family permease
MTATTAPETGQGHLTGYGTKGYRSFVLTSLMLVYILNFLDRGLLGVVAEEVMRDLGITDGQFGLLTGPTFAIFYAAVGIPLARLAERQHRVWIMAICIALWSAATAASGYVNPVTVGPFVISGFVMMLICRVLVGVGEAGCTPPANSLIADYYPPARRAAALGFYGMGVTLGTMSANLIGGPIADAYGWRYAFILMGFIGVAIAVVFKLTIKEPPRGYSDPPGAVKPARAGFGDAMKEIGSKPAFWLMCAAATAASFCGYGQTTFQTSFIRRSFPDWSLTEVTVFINAPVSLAASVSVFMTGWLASKFAKRHPNAIAWLPGVGIILAVPFYLLAYSATNIYVCLGFLMCGALVKYGYIGSQYTIGQGVVGAVHRRAQRRAVCTQDRRRRFPRTDPGRLPGRRGGAGRGSEGGLPVRAGRQPSRLPASRGADARDPWHLLLPLRPRPAKGHGRQVTAQNRRLPPRRDGP